jgi:hypothetical protein
MPKAKKEWPRTVEEAVDRLLSLMSEEDKQSLKNTPEKDLIMFHFGLGGYIRNEFGLCIRKKPNQYVDYSVNIYLLILLIQLPPEI